MNTNEVFEILNHGLLSKDPIGLLTIATSLECFRSPTLGNTELVLGESAPETFRKAVAKAIGSRVTTSFSVEQKIGDDRSAVYVLRVKTGNKEVKRALSLIMRGSKLIAFVESEVA